MPDMVCVRCNLPVDTSRKSDGSCRCTCRWPAGGCGEPIYMLVNLGENRQPFNLDGTAHHATCRAYIQQKNASTTCPACGGRRQRQKSCPHCGWSPDGRPPQFRVPTLDRFSDGGDRP